MRTPNVAQSRLARQPVGARGEVYRHRCSDRRLTGVSCHTAAAANAAALAAVPPTHPATAATAVTMTAPATIHTARYPARKKVSDR